MRVSQQECLRISQLRPASDRSSATAATALAAMGTFATAPSRPQGAPASPPVARADEERELLAAIGQKIAEEPDVREQVIASLKERIESGSYLVSGEQIAEMMIRRLIADQVH